jgi:hypothetical protein
MDAKITLSFNKSVIERAKEYADKNNMSLSRLTEFLLNKVTTGHYSSLEDYPISDWVTQISEGEAIYHTKPRSRKELSSAYFKSKK